MRTFLVVLFAIAAVAMGGMWLLVQTERPETADAAYETASSSAPAAPSREAAAETDMGDMASADDDAMSEEEFAAFDEEFGEEYETLEDSTVEDVTSEEDDTFAVAAAPPPPPPAPEPLVATQSLAEQFQSREVSYNRPPSTLALDHPIDVSLVINATGDEGAAAEALQGFDGTIVERDVELTDVVSAQLTGVGFDIVEQTVERQRLSPRVLNRWQWRVTPTKEGTQTLVLEIFGYANGALEGEPLDAYRDEIVVEVRDLDRLISFAQDYEPVFAIGAGVAGGLSALFGFLRFRGDRKRRKKA